MAVTPEDLANAEVELAQSKQYVDKRGASDANDPTASLSSLRAEGFEEVRAPLEPGKEDPEIMRAVYHAYDGRRVMIPEYMAKVRLAERFPREDFIPGQYHGQRVWFTTPQTAVERQHLLCLLHADQTDEIKAEVRKAGYELGRCNYSNGPSAAAVDKHMELKHKDEWRALQNLRGKASEAEYRDQQSRQTDAILKLAEALAKQNLK